MRDVYAMFRDGDIEPVQALANSVKSPAVRFYASLYLGLYAEACGDAAKSRSWIERAYGESGYAASGDYMYALSRVHAMQRGYL